MLPTELIKAASVRGSRPNSGGCPLVQLGCMSTRLRQLADKDPLAKDQIVRTLAELRKASEGNGVAESAYDSLCESWYLQDVKGDADAMRRFTQDAAAVAQKIRNSGPKKEASLFGGSRKSIENAREAWVAARAHLEELRHRTWHSPRVRAEKLREAAKAVQDSYEHFQKAKNAPGVGKRIKDFWAKNAPSKATAGTVLPVIVSSAQVLEHALLGAGTRPAVENRNWSNTDGS